MDSREHNIAVSVIRHNRSIKDVAENYGVSPSTVRRYMDKYDEEMRMPEDVRTFIEDKGFDIGNVSQYDVVKSSIENGYYLIVAHGTGVLSRFRIDERLYNRFTEISK